MFRRLPSLETLDDLNYRCVAWGFALFTHRHRHRLAAGEGDVGHVLVVGAGADPVGAGLAALRRPAADALGRAGAAVARRRSRSSASRCSSCRSSASTSACRTGGRSADAARGAHRRSQSPHGRGGRARSGRLRGRAARRRQPPALRPRGGRRGGRRLHLQPRRGGGLLRARRAAWSTASPTFLRAAQRGAAHDLAPHLYILLAVATRCAICSASPRASTRWSSASRRSSASSRSSTRRAASVGATGAVLHRWFHKAFSVAKRVRTETGIAGRAVSVSSAAVELATTIFDRARGQDRDAHRRRQDGRAGGAPPARQRRRRDDGHEPHLRPRRRDGARLRRHAGAVRALRQVPADGRHRHRLDGGDGLRPQRGDGPARRCASAKGGRCSAST